MLKRALAKEGVAERQQQLFRAAGVRHYRQLVMRSTWDVAHVVDLSVREMEYVVDDDNGLPAIDQAFCGGIKHGGITEFAGIAGIGKSQLAMTLSVLCAMENQDATVLYFDTEHNFSAKRLFRIAAARVRLRNVHSDADVNATSEDIVKRIRIVKVDALGKFITTYATNNACINGYALKELEESMHSMNVKLLVIDSIANLFLKSNDQTQAQRQHQMLKLTRDLKQLADTHQAFVVVTNRATIADSESGLYTKPQLGEIWSHCVTSRLIMERYPQYRVISIVKSPVAGYVVQPFIVDESGVQASVEEKTFNFDQESFDLHDDLLHDIALVGLPMVEPSCTLRSTQKSSAENDEDEDRNGESQQSSQDMFDLVSDSNDEEDDDFQTSIANLLEDR